MTCFCNPQSTKMNLFASNEIEQVLTSYELHNHNFWDNNISCDSN